MRDAPSDQRVSSQSIYLGKECSYAAEEWFANIAIFGRSLLPSTPDSFPSIPFYQPVELLATPPQHQPVTPTF